MNDTLRTVLLAGPLTVKEIAAQIGKSETRTRELLKADQSTIHSKKEDGRGNVFWLPAERAEGTPATTEVVDPGVDGPTGQDGPEGEDVQGQQLLDAGFTAGNDGEAVPPEGADVLTTCPFCQNEDKQTQAGPDGTFLGAANTCGQCGKTYNKFSGDEIKAPAKDKAKRQPLNPQYKINQRVEAVQKAGGKLLFDREAREWVLTRPGVDPKRMTATEFSIETPETLVAYIGK
jgi:hypothetical protein